jgi:hypothetical protein
LESESICTSIWHGDLAPWNIRVGRDGEWVVLDWERGNLEGIPGWDWFHFVIQPSVLVRRESAEMTIGRLEQLLMSPEFRSYAAQAGILAKSKVLSLGYLLYCERVARQSEGLQQISEVTKLLASRWLKNS